MLIYSINYSGTRGETKAQINSKLHFSDTPSPDRLFLPTCSSTTSPFFAPLSPNSRLVERAFSSATYCTVGYYMSSPLPIVKSNHCFTLNPADWPFMCDYGCLTFLCSVNAYEASFSILNSALYN